MHLACMGAAGMLARLAWEAISYQLLGRLGRQCQACSPCRLAIEQWPSKAPDQPAPHIATTKAPAAHTTYKLHVGFAQLQC